MNPASGLRRRILDPVLALLRQGITPDKLALSLAFGVGVGIFPVLGVSTPLLTLIALALKLNLPAIQLVNYSMTPVQLLLAIPFMRLGEFLTGAPPLPLTIPGVLALVERGVIDAVVVLWDAIVHQAIGWCVVGPLLILLLYRVLRPLLGRAAERIATTRASTP